MKKTLSFMMVMVLLLALAGCGQGKTNNSVLGLWETKVEFTVIGVDVELDEPTTELIYYYEFNEDGSGNLEMVADEEYLEYIPDPNLSFTYTLNDNTLEITYEDETVQTFEISFSGDNLIFDGRVHMELKPKK